MRYFKEYALSALAILMASCSSDNDTIEPVAEEIPVTNSNSMSFSASIESGEATRTALSSNANNPYPVWASGDKIKVLNVTTQDTKLFSIGSGDAGNRTATFTGDINVDRANPNKFYALYTGNVANTGGPTITQSGDDVTISGTIPSTQSSTPAFNPNLHFMTACTTNDSFHFKNGMALLKIYIADNTHNVSYNNFAICQIVFTANNGEKIAGDFTANISDDGTLTDYTVTNNANASSEITIGDGTTPLTTGYYYIAIHPCTLSKGFTLTYLDKRLDVNNESNCKQFDRIRTTSLTVAASKIVDLGTYTAKDCAKEAYVDLGLTRTIDGVSKKILFCMENVYDDETGKTSDVNSSYYAWGETYVKANQTKAAACQNYSWYYSYRLGQGSSNDDITYNMDKRSYKFGVGIGGLLDAWEDADRYLFEKGSDSGVLLKYNSNSSYGNGSITDWGSGVKDSKTELDLADDVAYQNSPNHALRMPAKEDFEALINATTTGSKPLGAGNAKNMPGFFKFKNKTTGNYILLPKGGYRHKTSSSGTDDPQNTNSNAYWTRNRVPATSYQAISFNSYDSDANTRTHEVKGEERCQGRMIRGVIYR